MTTLTPPNHDPYSHQAGSNGYGADESAESGRSPLSMSLNFLKGFTEKKNARVDGQPPKRRGPKPDSKPALTRRQELNRQAQRTHRERKELYIKALEQELLRLKENYSTVSRDKEVIAEENRKLKQLLAQHGISWNGVGGVDDYTRSSSVGYTSTGSTGGPNSTVYSPDSASPAQTYGSASPPNGQSGYSGHPQGQPGIDYDQAGIDFVLTLERPCMNHMQFLVERAHDEEGEICGHALMASCPPAPYIDDESTIPFGHGSNHLNGTSQKTWDITKSDLANLLDLSKRLNLDHEITPVMAWGMILSHPRFSELTLDNLASITLDLGAKVRCYGFGAVLEEFEVRDALAKIFPAPTDTIGMVI